MVSILSSDHPPQSSSEPRLQTIWFTWRRTASPTKISWSHAALCPYRGRTEQDLQLGGLHHGSLGASPQFGGNFLSGKPPAILLSLATSSSQYLAERTADPLWPYTVPMVIRVPGQRLWNTNLSDSKSCKRPIRVAGSGWSFLMQPDRHCTNTCRRRVGCRVRHR
jgi:hypothetical protein